MKNQTHLSELDATRLANFKLRQDLLNQEWQAFTGALMATYGNPKEALAVADDGRTLVRKPVPPPAKKRKR